MTEMTGTAEPIRPETIGELHDRLPKNRPVHLPEYGLVVTAWTPDPDTGARPATER